MAEQGISIQKLNPSDSNIARFLAIGRGTADFCNTIGPSATALPYHLQVVGSVALHGVTVGV